MVQQQGEELRVISYPSHSLSERRYSQTEKETLVIVWACERFHAYLYGAEFELMTVHKPLECIFSHKYKTCAWIDVASKHATIQVFSQIHSRSKEHCIFLITPVASNVKFKGEKPER